MLNRLAGAYREYPRTFWLMALVNFLDRLGGSILFPFFALYLTKRFEVGMTEVGALFAVFFVSSFIGSFPGGALADRFGRRRIIIFSLLATSLSALLMGFVGSFQVFIIVAFVSGIFTDVGGPAYEAVFMDVLPEAKRASGFGIRRVAFNLAVVAGPVIGGFLAARSYLALFVLDAIISGLVALLVFFLIPETKPALAEGAKPETTAQSFGGYMRVLRDGRFMAFVAACMLAWLVYMNMNTTLGVYLRDRHGVPESSYGWLVSLNAALVVLFQFPITRRIEKRPPMLMMALGTLLFAVSLGMYGVVDSTGLFVLAMVILTLGEMVAIPIANAVVASFSPEEMRGRYNFVYGNSWGIAFAVGPYLAGLALDGANPDLLWYACALVGSISALAFLWLHRRMPPKTATPDAG
ncbi:MAG: MFS transporter [Chloroflexi bacterium]|nr:MFS transporter [Chloroflexota bacterium]